MLARESLRDTGGAGLPWEQLYHLVLKATGSTVQAERAGRARRMEQMRAGERPK